MGLKINPSLAILLIQLLSSFQSPAPLLCICAMKTSSQMDLVGPRKMVTRGPWYFYCSSALCVLGPMHSSMPSVSSNFSTLGCFCLPGAEMAQDVHSARQIFPRHPTWNCSHFFFQYSGLSTQSYVSICFGFLFNHDLNGCNSACLMFSLESILHQWLFFQSCIPLNVLFALSLSALL